jgi:fructose-1,6-bisphosphatase I
MSMIVEQAGGKALVGTERVLELVPKALHQRVACCLGSPDEVDHVLRHLV